MTLIPIILEIQELLAAYFNITEYQMSDYYSDLYAAYHQECKSPSDGFIVTDKMQVMFSDKTTMASWKEADLTGIDFPFYFGNGSNKECVVIVGIDPLRNRRDFANGTQKNVIVGTPYALHSSFYRSRKGRTKVYFDTVEQIVDLGYNVYLTDIFKFWMNNLSMQRRGKNSPARLEMGKAERLLKHEIEIIQPKAVFAFGNIAFDYAKERLTIVHVINYLTQAAEIKNGIAFLTEKLRIVKIRQRNCVLI